MAIDFMGKEILPGDFVIQAAASGHHKYLKIAIVLEVISDNEVRVQSESRPGIVTWVKSRLLVLDNIEFMGKQEIDNLNRIYSEWSLKNA